MDKGKFFDQVSKQIERLSSAFTWKMDTIAQDYWIQDLSKREYSVELIEAAVTKLVFAGGTRFPSLGDLDKACRDIRCVRIEKDAERSKGPAERDAKAFFYSKEYRSPVAKDCMNLIRKVFLGVVKPRDLPSRMRELGKKHPKVDFDKEADALERHFEKLDKTD
jgi:hypothetical protein